MLVFDWNIFFRKLDNLFTFHIITAMGVDCAQWFKDETFSFRRHQCCGAGAALFGRSQEKGVAPAPAQGPAMTPCLKKRNRFSAT